jgi:hypothetical protein
MGNLRRRQAGDAGQDLGAVTLAAKKTCDTRAALGITPDAGVVQAQIRQRDLGNIYRLVDKIAAAHYTVGVLGNRRVTLSVGEGKRGNSRSLYLKRTMRQRRDR